MKRCEETRKHVIFTPLQEEVPDEEKSDHCEMEIVRSIPERSRCATTNVTIA